MKERSAETFWSEIKASLENKLRTTRRRDFATATGISTSTISKMVSSKWNELQPRQGTKAEHDWARIIATLAAYLETNDSDARSWLRILGLPDQLQIVQEARRQLGLRTADYVALAGDNTLTNIVAATERGQLTVLMAVMRFPPFSADREKTSHPGFLERYGSTLVQSIFPGCRVNISFEDDMDSAIGNLTGNEIESHLIVGLLDTIPRRMKGVDFIPIPALHSRLAPLFLRRSHHVPEAPDLKTILFRERGLGTSSLSTRVAVVEGESGHHFIAGACGYSSNELLIIKTERPDDIVHELRHQLDQNAKLDSFLLLADHTICKSVQESPDANESFASVEIISDVMPLPAYPLAIGVRADSNRWRDLIQLTQSRILWGSLLTVTVDMYALLLFAARQEGYESKNFFNLKNFKQAVHNAHEAIDTEAPEVDTEALLPDTIEMIER